MCHSSHAPHIQMTRNYLLKDLLKRHNNEIPSLHDDVNLTYEESNVHILEPIMASMHGKMWGKSSNVALNTNEEKAVAKYFKTLFKNITNFQIETPFVCLRHKYFKSDRIYSRTVDNKNYSDGICTKLLKKINNNVINMDFYGTVNFFLEVYINKQRHLLALVDLCQYKNGSNVPTIDNKSGLVELSTHNRYPLRCS